MINQRFFLTASIAISLMVVGNIAVLDYLFIGGKGAESIDIKAPQIMDFRQEDFRQEENNESKGITRAEVEEIVREATASLKPQIERVVATPQPTSVVQQTGATSVKELFVHLGSGSNNTDDWADVTGAEAYIDSTKYGKIKSVVFEASINIPTGNEVAYARLYNVTDKHPVWFSEVSHEGGGAVLLTSNPITLDSGNKLYRAQMKTSLKYLANITTARVKITVE